MTTPRTSISFMRPFLRRRIAGGLCLSAGLRLLGLLLGLSILPNLATASDLPDPVRFALAIERGDVAQVRAWLAAGLPADFMADRIGSGLMIAAWEGDLAMLETFVSHGASIDAVNRHDETALQLAAWRGHKEAVLWLLDHGATLNPPGARWTALHYASFANRQDVAGLLLARGAQVNAPAPNGSTALMMSAREGHDGMARQLLAAGADPAQANERGETALTWAMRQGHYRIAQLVSDEESFARAARAPASSFGPAQRSQPAPSEFEELLRQIRLAEAAGQPSASLRQQLATAVARFRAQSQRSLITTASQARPRALVITARRKAAKGAGTHAERAELELATPQPTPAPRTRPASLADDQEIAGLLQQIQQTRRTGGDDSSLRQRLYQALDLRRQQPR